MKAFFLVFLSLLVTTSFAHQSASLRRRRHHHRRTYDDDNSGCDQREGQFCGNGPRVETVYVYREENGKCIREPVRREADSCTCVPSNECPSDPGTTSSPGSDVNVKVGPGNVGVNVGFRRGRRDTIDHFFDHLARGFLDFIPNIDVNVRRPGIFGNRDVNVNVGGPHGVRVGVNRNPVRPWFSFGIGPDRPGSFYPGTWNTDRNGGDCPTCGGPGSSKPTPRRRVVPPPSARCPSGQVCCRPSGTPQVPQPTPPPEGSCGRRSACGLNPGKVNPKKGESNIGEYPWMAIILRVLDNGKKEFLCNGALIDNQRVLTVAQCVENFERYPDQLDVRLGEYDLEKDNEPRPYEDFQVSNIRIHSKYDNVSLINDIAILTLSKRVRNDIHISPICIPKERESFESRSCVTTGWGNRQPVLKEFPVECLGDDECVERLKSSKLGSYYQSHDLHQGDFCAQSRDPSASCTIDGGGPLVCRRKDGSFALIGLLSWSVDDYTPDIYVRVQYYLNFINAGQTSGATSELPQTTTIGVSRTTRDIPLTSSEFSSSVSPTSTMQPEIDQEIDQSQIDKRKHPVSPTNILRSRGLNLV